MGNFKKDEESLTSYIIALALILVTGIVPAICKIATVAVSPIENSMVRTATKVYDVFSYDKSIAICIIVVVILLSFGLEILTEASDKKFNFKQPQYIIIGVYALTVIVSALFSSYKPVAFKGISERYEGMWVLLAYVILFITTQIYINNKKHLSFVLVGFFLSALIVGGIGFFQFFGMDIFKSDFGVKLIAGDLYNSIKSLNIKFTDVYSTLYNPNCVGIYSAMLAPFFIALALYLPLRNPLKYVSVFFMLIMLVNLVGSSSAGGLVGFAAAMLVIALVFVCDMFINKKYKERPKLYWPIFIAGVAAFVIGLAAIFAVPAINTRFNSAVDSALNLSGTTDYYYKSFKVEDNKAVFNTANGNLTVEYDKNSNMAKLYGINGEEAVLTSKKAVENAKDVMIYTYANVEGIGGECLVQLGQNKLVFNNNNITFLFKVEDNGNLTALSKKEQPVDENNSAKAMLFDNNIYFATGRGYIWSRSIPVALKHFIIGSGPDTFAFEFPQDDIFEKIKVLGNPYIIVDKPHSIYLQSAINTGCISLIALLALFAYYIYRSFRSILGGNASRFTFAVKIAVLAGVCGYLVAGLATDSVVSVAPVFWVLLGTGYAVNKL